MNFLGLKQSILCYWVCGKHFISTPRIDILNGIQTAYSVKTLNVIKATVTCWHSHGATGIRTQERYPIIIKSLDNIITKDPKAELVGLHNQMLNSETLIQICFLEKF